MSANRVNVGGVEIDVRADNARLANDLGKAQSQVKKFADKAQSEANRSMGAISQIAAGVGLGIAGAFSIQAVERFAGSVIKAADSFTDMRSKLQLVIKGGEDLHAIEEKLFQQAQRNHASLEGTVELYARIRGARKDLSDQAAQEIVDNWSKTLLISGVNAQSAASATLQFSQAMASGVLQGDELKSILENNNRFTQLLSESLGVSVGQLRKLGAEGKLTTEVIVEAFQKGGGKLSDEAKSMGTTVAQASTNLGSAFVRLVGVLNDASGLTKGLAGAIDALANALGGLAKAVGAHVDPIDDLDNRLRNVKKTLGETDEIIAKNHFKTIGDQANDALPPLTAFEKKIDDINKKMIATGEAARTAAISKLVLEKSGMRESIAALEEQVAGGERLAAIRNAPGGIGMPEASKRQLEEYKRQLAIAKAADKNIVDRINEILQTPSFAFKPVVPASTQKGKVAKRVLPDDSFGPLDRDDFDTRFVAPKESDLRSFFKDGMLDKMLTEAVKEGIAGGFVDGPERAAFKDNLKASIADAFRMGIETGDWGKSFAEVLTGALDDALQKALTKFSDVLVEAMFPTGGKSGGIVNWISKLFGAPTAHAGGGSFSAWSAIRVGEMGPETLVMPRSGYVVPNKMSMPAGARESGRSGLYIGGPVVNINGNADGVTVNQMKEALNAFGKSLPSLIDQRVIDRSIVRGAY